MPVKPSTVVIGNPRSGRGKGAAALSRTAARLEARGHPAEVWATERPGHAVELAARAAGAELVLAVGGDGTVRDIAQGLATAGSTAAVGILPGGTGNDLARTLALPPDLDAALDVALAGDERTLDLWAWNRSLFVNVAGLGLDAAVAREVNTRFPAMRGPLPYLLALLFVLPRLKPQRVRLTWPAGGWEGDAWLAAFGNGRFYGGGMEIAPEAVPDDGLLDAVVIGGVPKLELLRELPGLFRGRHVRHPRVTSLQSASYRVEAADQAVTIDGELIDRAPAELTAASSGLRVRVQPRPT